MLNKCVPNRVFSSVLEIGPKDLLGIKGILIDLDGTMESSTTPLPSAAVCDWVAGLKQQGLTIVVLSNNNHGRVARFCQVLDVAFVSRGTKPLLRGFRKGLALLALPKNQVAMVGDQIFTDVLGGNLFGVKTFFIQSVDHKKPYVRLRYRLEKRFVEQAKRNEAAKRG